MELLKKKEKISIINTRNFDLKNKNKNSLNNKLIYLGPWCKNNIKLDDEDYKKTLYLNSPNNTKDYKKDVILMKRNYLILLKLLTNILNKIHKKKYKQRFWEITIGFWLYNYIYNTYSKWSYVKKIKKNFDVESLICSKIDFKDITPLDTFDASKLYHDRLKNYEWGEKTFEEIFSFIFNKKIKIIKFKIKKKEKKNKFVNLRYPINIFFNNSKKIFFYLTEISWKIKMKIIKILKSPPINIYANKKLKIDNKFNRDQILKYFPKLKKKKDFTNFVIKSLIYNIPKIFIEGFKDLENFNKVSKWPKKVNYIATCYGHYYDENFKLYLSNQIQKNKKTKFCVLQHGYANMFLCDDFYNVYLDRKLSDIFLSWGKLKRNKNTPFFYPKEIKNQRQNFLFSKNKKILIVSYTRGNSLRYTSNGTQNSSIIDRENLKVISNFLKLTEKNFSGKILIKNLQVGLQKNFYKSLKENFKYLVFESEQKNFLQVEKNYNLFVHTYIGTPFFESLALNKPTIVIYKRNFHLPFDKKFKSHLKLLKKYNILFEDEKLASKFLNKNYKNISGWWKNKELQRNIRKFSENYCNIEVSPETTFKKVFKV